MLRCTGPPKKRNNGASGPIRLNIVSLYNYTCALTGYRLLTVTSGSIIDAAHIHQFADSRNNDIRNGVALCKNAHWLFDNGLWTIADDYTVKVALGCFVEDSPDQKRPSDYHGQMIRLPGSPHSIPISPTSTGIGKRSSSEPADSIRPPSAASPRLAPRV